MSKKKRLPKNLQIHHLKKVCKLYGVAPDTIDLESLVDGDLSYRENKRNILPKIKALSEKEEEKLEYNEAEEEKFTEHETKRELEHFKEKFESRIEQIKKNNIQELKPYFRPYYAHIDSFIENQKVNGFLAVGNGGTGKSFNMIYRLEYREKEFELIKGHHTPLSFYRLLHENKDEEDKYLVIDDICKLIKDRDIISLLLSATDYDNRKVEWTSSSPLTKDLPPWFIFNSNIIILANEFDGNNKFLDALKDRCVFYKMEFSKEEMLEMLYILAQKRNYPIEIVDYLKELAETNVIQNLSLRLLDKLYPYYQKENWKSLVRDLLETDEVMNLVYELMRSGKSVKKQVKAFKERSGKSRRTYFRIKKKISAKVSSPQQYGTAHKVPVKA